MGQDAKVLTILDSHISTHRGTEPAERQSGEAPQEQLGGATGASERRSGLAAEDVENDAQPVVAGRPGTVDVWIPVDDG